MPVREYSVPNPNPDPELDPKLMRKSDSDSKLSSDAQYCVPLFCSMFKFLKSFCRRFSLLYSVASGLVLKC
jgi:hypothetical protein